MIAPCVSVRSRRGYAPSPRWKCSLCGRVCSGSGTALSTVVIGSAAGPSGSDHAGKQEVEVGRISGSLLGCPTGVVLGASCSERV
eukprot:2893824-Pleurochrysis_carterae.AAC.1